ncbi:MAG: 3-methyl-2-oxobutanoate dehydrogenase subunit VorB, partial [Bacteroidales bacterium]
AAAAGKKVFTSSSSPGISLYQEGISYIAGAELPCVIANVVRGGPGLGTIQPSQADYFQSTKGGGHGDYRLYVLAPASVQEMADFIQVGFDIAYKYRNPVMILSDGMIGQMMEKVELADQKPRWSDEEIKQKHDSWAAFGKGDHRERNIITSLDLDSSRQEKHNHHLQAKYRKMEAEEVLFEEINCDDAEYLIVAYGSSARISMKSVELARKKGIKVGLFRPITLYPFPMKALNAYVGKIKGILSVEMSAGQLIEDVKLAVECNVPVKHFGRYGGMIHSPEEVLTALEQLIIGG